MAFRGLSFAEHRIFWSRAAAILAIVYVILVPPPLQLGRMLLETGEIIGFFLLATAAPTRWGSK